MEHTLAFALIILIIVSLIVGTIWIFVPMAKKNAMDIECRKTLLKMENDNGLTETEKISLQNKLTELGLYDIQINGTPVGVKKKGEELNLRVEAKYDYRTLKSIFTTEKATIQMVYDRTTLARQVVK